MIIPADYKQVLHKVQSVVPSAVIAGGALRDIDYFRPVKDVDIFIPALDDYCAYEYARELVTKFPGLTVSDNHGYGAHAGHGRVLFLVLKIEIDGRKFDFVIGNQRACESKYFDFSICQIEYNGSEVTRSKDYIKTQETKVILVGDTSDKRLARIKAKYPEMKMEYYPWKKQKVLDETVPF